MHKKENWKYDESKKFKDIKSENIKIRDVVPEDAERIQEIYLPYVADIVISFEITVSGKSEMKKRIQKLLANAFPYIVAENENEPGELLDGAHHVVERAFFPAQFQRRSGIIPDVGGFQSRVLRDRKSVV